MTNQDGLVLELLLSVLAGWVLYLSMRIKSQQQHIDRLETRTYECVTEMLFRREQEQRRSLERKLDAMQEHLGLITVQQEARTLVVKKGNAP